MNIVSFKFKVMAFFLSFVLLISTSPLVFANADKDVDVQKKPSRMVKRNQATVSSVIPGNLYIPANTTFEVEITKELHSKKDKRGETVDLKAVDNLIVNGIIVIPKGTIGRGIITESRKAGGFGRKGKLTLEAQWIKAINNVHVPLNNELKSTGRSDGGAVAIAAAVSLVGGVFMKGTNVTYPAGTKFTVEIENDVDLGGTEEELALIDLNQPQGKEIKVITRN